MKRRLLIILLFLLLATVAVWAFGIPNVWVILVTLVATFVSVEIFERRSAKGVGTLAEFGRSRPYAGPVKPRLLTLLLLLLAGAIVSVGVAWSCAYWWCQINAISSPMGDRSAQLSPTPWRVTVPADWPQRPTREVARASAWYAFVDQISVVEDQNTYFLSEFRFGLPAKSLSCYQLSSGRPRTSWSPYWSFAMEFATGGTYPLPARPLWPGFAVNTLFYATILWLLIRSPLALRRFLRVRRGLCPKCAYPMGESAVCTECGIALPSSTNRGLTDR